jgi:hypothetical protein
LSFNIDTLEYPFYDQLWTCWPWKCSQYDLFYLLTHNPLCLLTYWPKWKMGGPVRWRMSKPILKLSPFLIGQHFQIIRWRHVFSKCLLWHFKSRFNVNIMNRINELKKYIIEQVCSTILWEKKILRFPIKKTCLHRIIWKCCPIRNGLSFKIGLDILHLTGPPIFH